MFPSLSLSALLLLAGSASASRPHWSTSKGASPDFEKRATVCNGHEELCSRQYSNVSFVGAHDSYAVGTSNVAANQDHNVTQQLTDGIRMLQIQTHWSSGELRLCHSSCLLLDAGTLTSYLTDVNTWAIANPNEVLSILMVNIDNINATEFSLSFESSGLDQISYSPDRATLALSEWPTMGELIDSGKRVVTFMDNTADFTTVPYIIDEFSNMFEDAYNVLENSFPCTANRSTGDPSTQLMLTNHYLDVAGSAGIVTPDKTQIVQTNGNNGTGSLGQGADNCLAQWGRYPNFMLVDFYTSSQGAVFDVAAELNGVSAPTNTIAPYLAGSSTKSSAAASSSGGVTSEPLSAGHRGVGGFTGGMTGLMGLVGVVTGLGLVGGAKILF